MGDPTDELGRQQLAIDRSAVMACYCCRMPKQSTTSEMYHHLIDRGVSGQLVLDMEATEPVGDPMDELGLELPTWRLSTPLRLIA